ncbi:Uncharacterised protein [Mycobacteroides abscessus subsp. massiliense]|nr:Uncharacterised protein [Mycobacteroides abscessus subsp. massiliense]
MFGDPRDERADIGVLQPDLRRADRGEAVVAAPLLISRHDVVHRRPAVEHHLEQTILRNDATDGRQRGVLTDGSAICAVAKVAIATWVNCVRYSTPSGCW